RSLITFPCGGGRLAAAFLRGTVPRRFPGGPARRVDHGDTTGGAGTGDGCEFVLTGPYGRPVRLHIRTVQHLPHAAPLVVREQCHHGAGCACAGGAACAVQIVLGVGRWVDVQYETDVVDVDAARGDIGRHQHRGDIGFEVVEDPVALPLGLATVQRDRVHATVTQSFGERVDVLFGAHEHDGAALASTDFGDNRLLVPAVHLQQVVFHGGDVGCRGCHGVGHRVGQIPLDQF